MVDTTSRRDKTDGKRPFPSSSAASWSPEKRSRSQMDNSQAARYTLTRPNTSVEPVYEDSMSEARRDAVSEGLDEEDDHRFFGGGLSTDQAAALDYLAEQDKEESGPVEKFDLSAMRQLAARFEKAITKNQKLRARFAEEPSRFLESEVELDEAIKSLSVLSEYPTLLKDFVDMGCLASLVSLIAHENTDIACEVVQILSDLLAEETSATDDDVTILVDGLRSSQALEFLCQILTRLDEVEELERDAIFQIMSIIENVVTTESTLKEYVFRQTSLCSWLLKRIQQPDTDLFSQNKQYAAELLSILVHGTKHNIDMVVTENAVDIILLLLAPYRKTSPEKDSLEDEYLQNLFDILDTVLSIPSGKDKFIEEEGVELMQRLYIDAKSTTIRSRALQVVGYGCDHWSGGAVCAQVVRAGLLRSLFTTFMKKDNQELLKIILGILVSFFRTLNDGEAERFRVLNKFMEQDCHKVTRLLELRRRFQDKHDVFHLNVQELQAQRPSMSAADRVELELTTYLDRLENGLDALQHIDIVLAWLIASDDKLSHSIRSHEGVIDHMRQTLTELQESLTDKGDLDGEAGSIDTDERQDARLEHEMIQALLDVLGPASMEV